MKAIQITVDEKLLARLDRDAEVKRTGRSAVFRRAVEQYLSQRRARAVHSAYQRAYGDKQAVDAELGGWAEEGVWPER